MKNKSSLFYISFFAIGFLLFSCKNQNNFYNLPEIGNLKSRSSGEINDNYWGIQASTLDPVLLERMTDIGVKWTRLGASWPAIESRKGVYNWDETDEAFRATLDASIIPFVTLGGGNDLYVPRTTYDDPELAEIYGYKPAPPTHSDSAMAAWLRFVEAAITRYKDQITYWEIWNEPNHRNYWGAPPDAYDYGRLVKETAIVIRAIQPGAKVIAGSMAGLDPEFIDGFMDRGVHEFVDIISYHNYGAIPEERIYRAYEAWEVINQYNPDIEMWQGECGYPSHSSTRDFRGTSPWGLNIQSKWLLRQAFTDIYFCRATMSNYFKLVHDRGYGEMPERSFLSPVDSILGFPERGGSRVKTVGVNEKCLLTNPGFEPKPAYFAYRNLCALIDKDFKPVYNNDHDITIKDQGPFYGIGPFDDAFPSIPLVAKFQNSAGKNLVAYWLPWHPQEYLPFPAKISLSIPGIEFEGPVMVDLLDGKIYRVEGPDDLPLMDYPLVIMGKSMFR